MLLIAYSTFLKNGYIHRMYWTWCFMILEVISLHLVFHCSFQPQRLNYLQNIFCLSYLSGSDSRGNSGDWGRGCRRGRCITGGAGDRAGDIGHLRRLGVISWCQLQVILPLSSHSVAIGCSMVPGYINPAWRKKVMSCNCIIINILGQRLNKIWQGRLSAN